MAKRSEGKLNQLVRDLPEGLLVDAAWLERQGYSTSLRSQYVSAGWLQQPARRVYWRPTRTMAEDRSTLTWQQVVISLQMLLDCPLIVGGKTALELHGFAHYLAQEQQEVHLYGLKAPPAWVSDLPLQVAFRYHNSAPLFQSAVSLSVTSLIWDLKNGRRSDPAAQHQWVPSGHWEWPIAVSRPERAVLELLDELPAHESFDHVDKLMEGLANLNPRRLQKLLTDCSSVKVKRLFFFFADRHRHSWLKQLNKGSIDLGSGKRSLVKGGRLDPTYQITVPEDLDGVQ